MEVRELIKKLLDKDLDSDIMIVVNTDDGRRIVPIKTIYQSDDVCLEVDIRQWIIGFKEELLWVKQMKCMKESNLW